MKNIKNTYLIVGISLFVGLLHFLIGPDYNGFFPNFITGYLIDILLPMNLYLLLQISLRKKISIRNSRIIGAVFTFLFGLTVEILQFYKIKFLGSTYDIIDIAMYATGVILGLLIDFTLIDKLERQIIDNEKTR